MQTDFTKAPEVIEATQLVERTEQAIGGYKITTPAQYEDSAGVLRKIMAGKKRLEELRTAITGPLNASLKAVNDLFRTPAERLLKAEQALKGEIARYQDEQERIRREEQRIADEKAAAERRKREAEAREAQRVADEKAAAQRAEAQRQREAAEKAEREAAEAKARGDAAAAAKAEAERQEAQRAAAKAENSAVRTEERAADKVATLEMQAATVVAPVIHREAPKVAGVATREVWKYEITDASKINPQFLMPDEKKIGAQVRALRGDAAGLIGPGVRVWSERQIAAGAA